jgi:hypothetical protein
MTRLKGVPRRPARGVLQSEPERMTTRARVFMAVVATRNIVVGLSLLLAQKQYGEPNLAFGVVRAVMPIPVWGIAMVAIGILAGCSAAALLRPWATWAIALSATISGTWCMCLSIQFVQVLQVAGGLSPMLPVLWGALTAKDLVIAWQPMRSPFEPVIRRLLSDSDSDEATPTAGEVT